MSISLALIALGVGYLVFTAAFKEKKELRLLGQIIGIAVMAVALATSICSGTKCVSKTGCPLMGKSAGMMGCPVSGATQEMPPAK